MNHPHICTLRDIGKSGLASKNFSFLPDDGRFRVNQVEEGAKRNRSAGFLQSRIRCNHPKTPNENPNIRFANDAGKIALREIAP
jgi:hypothetical protein